MIPVVDRVVSAMRGCDQVFGVEDPFLPILNVPRRERIHVMDKQTKVNDVAENAEIATMIANNDPISSVLPLLRLIEVLIDPPIKPECRFANVTPQRQVLKTLFKG